MTSDDRRIEELARSQGVSAAASRAFLARLRALAGADQFYIFWTPKKSTGSAGAPRARTLLAFQTPDAALAFAQRNRSNPDELPRLRRLELAQLALAALREPAIVAIVFVAESDDPAPPVGQLPVGLRVERDELVRWLHESPQQHTDSQGA